MLKRDVEIGENLALRHQLDHLVDMGIGVDIVEPHPDAERAELAREIDEFGAHGAVSQTAFGIFQIRSISARVLRNDEELLGSGCDQGFSASRSTSAAGRETRSPRKLRDDAEGAAIVAAFRNLQIGVVARRQLDSLRRHQFGKGSCGGATAAMDRRHHALVLLRAGDRRARPGIADGSGSAPMQPVTMTLPFSAAAAPIAASDSALALSRNPQVLTMTAVGAVMRPA